MINTEQRQAIIEIKELSKRYGKTLAVDHIDLTVYENEIFGFLGPNGAGKSTTLRILTTLTKPDSGTALVGGFDVCKQAQDVKKQIGVVQQTVSFDRDISLGDNMQLHARMHGYSPSDSKKMTAEALQYCNLTNNANTLINDLSGGMRRIATIARALMHNPRIIFLDEPTTSLDAQTRRKIWSRVRQLREQGSTVFLTTHYIEEAEALCDRVAIIHKGCIIAIGTPLELRQMVGLWTVEYSEAHTDSQYRYFPSEEEAKEFIGSLPESQKAISLRPSNLEDIFIEYTGQKVGGSIEEKALHSEMNP